MDSNQISLYIGGTKQRQAGFADLVICGVFPSVEFNNMDHVTLISEKPVLILKHTRDYILYQLVDRKVKSFNADANGVLSIAVAIPASMQFAAGRSPYTLLKQVYDTFRTSFMTPYSDGRDSFLDVAIEKNIFQQIIDQYSLEPRRTRLVETAGSLTGMLAVPQEKMEDFFRDTQYPEFSEFKEIEVGTMCQSSPQLEQLEIPRPASYDVYVNEMLKIKGLYKQHESCTVCDTGCETIVFTLAELEAAPGFTITAGKSEARLDKASGKIFCRLAKKEILYKCRVTFHGSDTAKKQVQDAVESGEIRIYEKKAGFDIMKYRLEGFNFEISSEVLKSYVFELDKPSHNGMRLSILTQRNPDNQTIDILVKAEEPEPVVIPANRGGVHGKSKNGRNGDPVHNAAKNQSRSEVEELKRSYALREEELNKEWEKRLSKSRTVSLLIGFVSALLLCALAGGFYYLFLYEEPAKPVNYSSSEKERIFKEVLEDKLSSYVDDFIETPEAEKIAVKYNERKRQDSQGTEDEGDGVSNTAPAGEVVSGGLSKSEKLRDEVEQNDKEKLAKEETARKAKEEAERKAAKEKAAAAKEKARAEILELVKKKDYEACEKHPGWKTYLTKEERWDVEKVLKPGAKYKNRVIRNTVIDYVNDKVFNGGEITWELLKHVRRVGVQKIESNSRTNLPLMEGVN